MRYRLSVFGVFLGAGMFEKISNRETTFMSASPVSHPDCFGSSVFFNFWVFKFLHPDS